MRPFMSLSDIMCFSYRMGFIAIEMQFIVAARLWGFTRTMQEEARALAEPLPLAAWVEAPVPDIAPMPAEAAAAAPASGGKAPAPHTAVKSAASRGAAGASAPRRTRSRTVEPAETAAAEPPRLN
jgi:hypothetical protein